MEREPRPYRCKDGERPSKLIAARLRPEDVDLIREIGDGSVTRGIEYLLEIYRTGLSGRQVD